MRISGVSSVAGLGIVEPFTISFAGLEVIDTLRSTVIADEDGEDESSNTGVDGPTPCEDRSGKDIIPDCKGCSATQAA